MRYYKLSAILSGLLLMNVAFADGTTLGIGVGYGQKAYKGDDSEWVPIPYLDLQSGMVFIKGLRGGINVIDNTATNLNFNVGYQSLNFKPRDSVGALKQLDKRKSTLTMGAGFTQNFEYFFLKAGLDADILGRSKGVQVDLSVGKSLPLSGNFTIVPKGGVLWSSKKHNNYYYGVSNKEMMRSGVQQYQTGSSFTPYLGIGANYNMTQKINLYGGVKVDILPSKVKNSPMVDRSTNSNFALGINYEF